MVRFHTNSRRRSVWRRIVPFLTFVAVISVSAWLVRLSGVGTDWEPIDEQFTLCGERSSNGCVIDGDTIMIGRRKIRLTGFNAPELAGECEAETQLARQSSLALRDWLNQGSFEISGGDEPAFDQYGRELRELKRGDDLLADIMIGRSLAQGSGWGFERGGWCD